FCVLGIARREQRTAAGLLAWIAILTGLSSVALHATSTLVGQLLDQSAMFLESSFFIVFNVYRWRRRPLRHLVSLYTGIVAISVILLLSFPTLGITLFIAHVTTFLAIELRLHFRDGKATRYRALAAVGVTFALAWAAWWLDILRIACNPRNHIFNGHALWHLLGALSF